MGTRLLPLGCATSRPSEGERGPARTRATKLPRVRTRTELNPFDALEAAG
jgi:hypothetical protein